MGGSTERRYYRVTSFVVYNKILEREEKDRKRGEL